MSAIKREISAIYRGNKIFKMRLDGCNLAILMTVDNT